MTKERAGLKKRQPPHALKNVSERVRYLPKPPEQSLCSRYNVHVWQVLQLALAWKDYLLAYIRVYGTGTIMRSHIVIYVLVHVSCHTFGRLPYSPVHAPLAGEITVLA